MTQIYNDPAGGQQSTIGNQTRIDHIIKKSLIEARKEQYFMPLSGTVNMPKHFGKKIKKFHYLPLLDDANINDQGIDAAGVTISNNWEVVLKSAVTVLTFAVEANATAVQADIAGSVKAGAGPWTVTLPAEVSSVVVSTQALTVNVLTATEAAGAIVRQLSGNLYGSSKDVGLITGKLPVLSETGGRVNRVGFKRKEVEGSLEKFGFFDEYTKESMDFDSDPELQSHIHREMLNGATEITEDALQIDLLNSAGILKYAGAATMDSELDATTEVTYGDLLRLGIDLDNNRCPKQTKVITGTRLIDTKTIPACRVMFIGSELIPMLDALQDQHGNQAFIPVQKYAAGGTVLNGEIGTIGPFRIVVVPEMLRWAGAGGDASATATHYETADRYDVFPMLVVGDGSFTTIGFQTDGKTVKFKITHKPPGDETADRNDPYGELGFMSIKWYYGFLLERPERIALFKTTAKL
ncbi:MAG: N4-gp56 family major capsid protein [Gammaproteobacteria bacterium]|nr:MAG: N4-gp56 family major capsid protein [Gammaproteobacteria bacterium]